MSRLIPLLWIFQDRLESLHPEYLQTAHSQTASLNITHQTKRGSFHNAKNAADKLDSLFFSSTVKHNDVIRLVLDCDPWDPIYGIEGLQDDMGTYPPQDREIEFQQHEFAVDFECIMHWIKSVSGW